MATSPMQIALEITPRQRIDLIDVSRLLREEVEDFYSRYRKTLHCSYHTTAGFLEQSLCARLRYSRERLGCFLGLFQELFPPDADYRHDKLRLRHELSEAQRRIEPRNADSHLAYIGSGLNSCVTYRNLAEASVHLIDLDGVHEHGARRRRVVAVGYQREELVTQELYSIPVSRHPIDSISLKDDLLGLFPWIREQLQRYGIGKGRIDLSLAPTEHHSGLTVNEFETLLMRYDLAEVLQDPLRFMAGRGRSILRDPRAIPTKTLSYARYDLVRIINQLMDLTGMSESIIERALAKFMAAPARRFLRMKRAVSLLVSDEGREGVGDIVQGPYQSPVLVQWEKAPNQGRQLEVRLVRFA